ncbi:MAG TPA: C39 family peptidase [Nocardioidaceae bacterium]
MVSVVTSMVAVVGLTVEGSPVSSPSAEASTVRHAVTASKASVERVALTRWVATRLRDGHFDAVRFARVKRGIVVGARPAHVTYRDPYGHTGRRSYERGRWTSDWVRPAFAFERLIASYNASTPVGTFIEVAARARTTNGRIGSWDSLGRWASHDTGFHRMSLGSQRDDVSRVAVDTLIAQGRLVAWQLRVSLFRRTTVTKTPVLRMVGAVASRIPERSSTSRPGPGVGHSLLVPRYSQEIHRGEYPRYNGGGEAWCSPTSTSMVLGYWHRLPPKRQYAWVDPSYADPWVDHAARFTYAWGYGGTGDWPFNTAYAARYGLDAFVTRLRSLREAELFIRAGIPLVATIAFGPGELDGAPIHSTSGHLVVIRGFTRSGRVIVNDPAAARNKGVRRVYKRAQFENAWSDRGGVVYVIHPASKPLPAPRRHSNW